MEKIRILDPAINIPDPQHCHKQYILPKIALFYTFLLAAFSVGNVLLPPELFQLKVNFISLTIDIRRNTTVNARILAKAGFLMRNRVETSADL